MLEGLAAGPAGPWLAIALMALATYLCRVSGVVLMSRIRITPRVERALRALPGSIVAATVVPIGIESGPAALLGLATGMAVMAVSRSEVGALFAGLAAVTAARAAGV
jgi:uncharacterized membrane protein